MDFQKDLTPWDFYKVHSRPFVGKGIGLHVFFFPDAYLERILLYRNHNVLKKEKDFLFVGGQELTVDWIEQNWIYADLFGTEEIFYVLQPELISQNVIEYILQMENISKSVIFSFTTEVAWGAQIKKKAASCVEIRPPKFWEGSQLLELIMLYFDLELNYEAQQYILECLPQETGILLSQLNLIKVRFPDSGKVLDIKDIQPLVERQKLDFFLLANLFGKKKFKQFYSEVISFEGDLEDLFKFMQNHILKMYDPSYIQKKSRPTKYDKEIGEYCRLWKKDELLKSFLFFGDLHLKSKAKNPLFVDELRLKYLYSI